MIKFRCPNCARKIAVNDDASGVVFACPACATFIAVPVETAPEFRSLPVLVGSSAPITAIARDLSQAGPHDADERFLHRARLLRDAVLQALLGQWRQLLDNQQTATGQMAVFEQRLALVQQQYAKRLTSSRARVAELESALAIRSEQTRRLQQENVRLTEKLRQAQGPVMAGSGVDLRDAGTVLRV